MRFDESAPEVGSVVTIVAHAVGPVGGQELQLYTLINGLLSRGVKVKFVGRECGIEPHEHFTFVKVRGPARPFPLAYLWFFFVGSIATARHRVGVLQTTGAIVFNRADISVVHFCHAAYRRSPQFALRASSNRYLFRVNAIASAALSRLAERYVYRKKVTRMLVPVSNGVARELAELFSFDERSIRVIPNGVDTNRFRPDPEARLAVRRQIDVDVDASLAIFVGGDWGRKGLEFAVRGVARTATWNLLVVGPGDREEMAELADKLGAIARVKFVGKVNDTAPFFAAADALVFPTAYEAFPLTVLEAASSGLAIVATKVNGVEDLMDTQGFGRFIARDGDSVATALESLAKAPRSGSTSSRAREAASRFSWNDVISDYEDLITELQK